MNKKQEITIPERSQPPHKLILIIDGDPRAGMLLRETIRQTTSYHAFCVSNGHRALTLGQEVKPDFILPGAGLPDMKSRDLPTQLHHLRKLEQLPVLFLYRHSSSREPEADSHSSMKTVRFPTINKLFDLIEHALI